MARIAPIHTRWLRNLGHRQDVSIPCLQKPGMEQSFHNHPAFTIPRALDFQVEPDHGRRTHSCSLIQVLRPTGMEKSSARKPELLSGTWLPRLSRSPVQQTQLQQALTRNLTWVRLRSHFSRGLVGLRAMGSRPVLSFTLALS